MGAGVVSKIIGKVDAKSEDKNKARRLITS